MPFSWTLLNLLAVAVLAWLAVGIFTALARRLGMLSHPGPRSSHARSTATGGGAGIVLALLLAAVLPGLGELYPAAWRQGVIPALVVLGLVGFLDDLRGLPVWPRLIVQLAVSLWLLGLIPVNALGESGPVAWACGVIAMLYLVGMMNAWNFMDGSHGMAGAQGLFTGIALAVVSTQAGLPALVTPALAMSVACAGFLPWNLGSPRVFLGDAGSVPLGFAAGALLVLGVAIGALPLFIAVLLPAVFLVDSGLTLSRRVLRGERWYTPHKQHLYQRLIVSGWSHSRVLALYQAVNFLVVLPAAVLGVMNPGMSWAITGMVYMALVISWTTGSLKHGGEP